MDENYGHTVGKKKPNAFGLYDMHGNVSEWCRDGWQADLLGGIDPFVAADGDQRIIRGGSMWFPEIICRSDSRDAHNAIDRRLFNSDIGFRVALCRVWK